jgi:formylglycine-generating enzyme required for sulfatase activity
MIFSFFKLPDFRKTRWMHVLFFCSAWLNIQANNIQVSNLVLTGQNVSAGVNNASNFTHVKFDVRWENSWRHNSSNGGLSYIGVKTGGAGYTGAPIVYIGNQGSVAWQSNTFVTEGQLLFVSGTPNLYYRVTATHTTLSTAPTHNTGTLDNLEFVTINEGGGTGATATATIVGGVVTGFTITNAGTGYTTVPTVSVFSTNGGSGASADAYIKSWWDAAWVFVKFKVGGSDPAFTNVTLTSGSSLVTLPSTAGLRVGMPIYKSSGTTSLAWGAVITAINPITNQITMSTSPTGTTASNNTLIFRRIWEHALLNNNGHTQAAGSTIDVGLRTPGSPLNISTNPALGVFIYRNAVGTGNNVFNGIQLRWNYVANGINDTDLVEVDVFAMEMVYVPQGSFFVGSGGAENASFTQANNTTGNTVPFLILSTPPTLQGNNVSSSLSNLSARAGAWDLTTTTTTAALAQGFPTGYVAFYCMKYELSQGQCRDFLNKLTYPQQVRRTQKSPQSTAGSAALANSNSKRMGIDIMIPGDSVAIIPAVYACNSDGDGTYNETVDGEWIACNWLSWMDGCAYQDWSGLRPMTELEYEKAGRGDQTSLANEKVWGNTTVLKVDNVLFSGEPHEIYMNNGANCACGNDLAVFQGPVRVGAFAAASTTRTQAGASYWGIMELAGNLWELTVTIGNATGRGFTGVHGDGILSLKGHATENNWPGLISNEVTGATGSGARGGAWNSPTSSSILLVSGRGRASTSLTGRIWDFGCRGVRTAP